MDFHVIHLLASYHKRFSHKQNRAKNLSDTESMICSYVYSNPNCSQEDVVSAMNADKTTVAKAVRSLEEKGYAIRVKDEVDKRVNHIRLTEEGYTIIAELTSIHGEWMEELLSRLPAKDRQAFESISLKLLEIAKDMTKEE